MKTPFVPQASRSRTRSNQYNKTFSVTTTGLSNYVPVTYYGEKTYMVGDVMTDIVTPGFAQRSSDGEIILNPMNKSHTYYGGNDSGWGTRTPSGNTIMNYGSGYAAVALGINQPPAHDLDLSSLRRYVQTQCLSSVKTSNFMGLVAAAEARKTLRMLANPLGTLASLVAHVSQLRKAGRNLHVDVVDGNFRRINGRLFRIRSRRVPFGKEVRLPRSSIIIPIGDAVSGSVLAHNLGLRPLLMDIESVFQEIPKAHQLSRQSFRNSSSLESAGSSTAVIDDWGWKHTRRLDWTHKATVRATIVAGDTFSVSQDFGVSLYDVPEAAWELIPYSFIVDYVVNIGDVLGAQRALATQKILGSCLVTTIESVAKTVWLGTQNHANGSVVTKALTGEYECKLVTKQRAIGLQDIGLTILPQSRMLAPSHIQNVLSLTVQQLLGINKPRQRTFY